MALLISVINAKPFEDQSMIGFPQGMPVPEASLDARIKGDSSKGFEPHAGPISPDENFPSVQPPFSQKCEKHIINSTKNEAPKQTMTEKDILAFYPMSPTQATQINVVIIIKETAYKVSYFSI